jgi:putative Mg2+ transporter-C (MgtC) family protein
MQRRHSEISRGLEESRGNYGMFNFEMDIFVNDLTRIGAAAVLGGLIGIERELSGHAAGLRTHMLVTIGCAMFVVAGLAVSSDKQEEVTRVIQGVAAGIGFLGAGTILKNDDEHKITGLTTASSIWLAAALGTLAGLGEFVPAAAATVIALVVLGVLLPIERSLERRLGDRHKKNPKAKNPPGDSI